MQILHIIVAQGLVKGTVVALRMIITRQMTTRMVMEGAMVRLPTEIRAVEEGVVPLPIKVQGVLI